jgi:CIC family chloride channel protein
LFADYIRKLPIDLRTYLLPFIYGLFGGLAAVAFQKGVSIIFSMFWEKPSQQMPPGAFAFFSLATILAASIIAGLILAFVSRDAAGSGIPQVKVAFWRDFGFMPAKVVIAKFFAGAISIGGVAVSDERVRRFISRVRSHRTLRDGSASPNRDGARHCYQALLQD